MALGIPTVATAVGANFRVIENGVSGFLVKDKKEWVGILAKLLADASLRKTIGIAARNRVINMFSVNANKEIYLSVFKEILFNKKS